MGGGGPSGGGHPRGAGGSRNEGAEVGPSQRWLCPRGPMCVCDAELQSSERERAQSGRAGGEQPRREEERARVRAVLFIPLGQPG